MQTLIGILLIITVIITFFLSRERIRVKSVFICKDNESFEKVQESVKARKDIKEINEKENKVLLKNGNEIVYLRFNDLKNISIDNKQIRIFTEECLNKEDLKKLGIIDFVFSYGIWSGKWLD